MAVIGQRSGRMNQSGCKSVSRFKMASHSEQIFNYRHWSSSHVLLKAETEDGDQTEIKQFNTLTLVVVVPGQPFAFGAVGGSDDADRVATLHRQVVLTDFTGHHHLSVVHWLLVASHLESTSGACQKIPKTTIKKH